MTRNYTQFPNDDNGNVLWQMYEDGDDLSEAHDIEFSVAFTTQDAAEKFALYLLHQEQKVSLFEDDERSPSEWIVTIYVHMEPEYTDITDLEEWLITLATRYGGEYDGWGCLSYVYDDEDEI